MIIINNKFGNVALNLDAKNITVRLSGGFDSCVLLYILASEIGKRNLDVTIFPITVIKVDNERFLPGLNKFDPTETVENIINFVRSSFPNVKIKDARFQKVTDWWHLEEKLHIKAQHSMIDDIKKETNSEMFIDYNGITKNPSCVIGREIFEDRDQNGRLTFINCNPERHRDHINENFIENTVSVSELFDNDDTIFMSPFRNFDKRITFKLAEDYGILEFVLHNTRSCEGRAEPTNNFTTVCTGLDICWWCYERDWALKNYDKDYRND